MRVHHHDAVVALDDGRVAVDLVGGRGHRHVHAVGDFLEVEPRVASIRSLMRTAVHRCLLFWWGAPIWPPTPPRFAPRGTRRRSAGVQTRMSRSSPAGRQREVPYRPPTPPRSRPGRTRWRSAV